MIAHPPPRRRCVNVRSNARASPVEKSGMMHFHPTRSISGAAANGGCGAILSIGQLLPITSAPTPWSGVRFRFDSRLSDRLGSTTITQATPIRDSDHDDDFIRPRCVGHRDRDSIEMRE